VSRGGRRVQGPWRAVMSCMENALPFLETAGLDVGKLVQACEGAASGGALAATMLNDATAAAESTSPQTNADANADAVPVTTPSPAISAASTSSSTTLNSSSGSDLDGPPRTDRPIPTPRFRAEGYPLTGTTLPSADETPGGSGGVNDLGGGGGSFGSGRFGLDGFFYSPRCVTVMQKYNRWGGSTLVPLVVHPNHFIMQGCTFRPTAYGLQHLLPHLRHFSLQA